mmetsp:Transcript_14902/g.28927  ORF Transcript_14902/g.28927 Transcript_14902/m.28927 type:complete len:313 (+) Transcript_14902:398-1336(+)|eukprot:CAMPEP_0171513732 /NCGR_PEP_ID=MMETSP0959-20130129/2418_1 /TAXON_ID=87120 /ORGANISM="Aurantiochytrium limacinum, Strain ATCCMYA-1381" /LENGTH=312 /DNA_ID=CAMNT_0012051911 /DNA_START=125 /DNA_END=1063 /DNA_ORIENTATION=-
MSGTSGDPVKDGMQSSYQRYDASVIGVLVGVPGAGKSELCRKLQISGDQNEVSVRVVEFDALEDAEKGDFGRETAKFEAQMWHVARQEGIRRVEGALQDAKDSKRKVLVLVDDNMYYQSMRVPFRQLAQKFGAGYLEILVDCNLQVALERNKSRDPFHRRVPDSVIERMATLMEPPTPQRRFVRINTSDSSLSSSKTAANSVKTILRVVQDASLNPEINKELLREQNAAASREDSASNERHQKEIQLRRVVSEFIQKAPNELRREAAQLAAKIKSLRGESVLSSEMPLEDFRRQLDENFSSFYTPEALSSSP